MVPSRLKLLQHSSSSPRQKRFHRSKRSHLTPFWLRLQTLVWRESKKRHGFLKRRENRATHMFCFRWKDFLPENGVWELFGDEDGEDLSVSERTSHCGLWVFEFWRKKTDQKRGFTGSCSDDCYLSRQRDRRSLVVLSLLTDFKLLCRMRRKRERRRRFI